MIELMAKADPIPQTFTTDAEHWEAVLRRDRTADGRFFYSVRTTGVYCRPSCGARRARRENVRFHLTASDAEAAGFRPCKRCRPTEPSDAERQTQAIATACRMIEDAEQPPTLDELAAAVGLNRFYFHRLFRAITGMTPKAYADAHRGKRVRHELSRRSTVTDAIYSAGFNSNGRFYAASSDILGMTPTSFRTGGRGTAIRFAVGECWLGSILVAATERGVCAITFGDEPDALVRELQDQYPRAELIGGNPEFEELIARVVGFIGAPEAGLDLPLDVRGTAFQHRVWRALREIPAGSTASYGEIARKIGSPRASRAVAAACAKNALAVAIPCHRVVRTDGGLSGYRWGVERKRALLDRESALFPPAP